MNIRHHISLLVSLVAISIFATTSLAQEPSAGKQVEQKFKSKDGTEVDYLLYLPADYDPTKEHPLMLFLHGRGESNGPLSIVAKWGPPRMVARGDALPYIIVSPQCPKTTRWGSEQQQNLLVELLDHIQATYAADQSRVYLTGLSMGGYGSWRMAADHGDRFAACAIVCGGGDPADAEKLASVPIWVFHGDKDKAVPLQKSTVMVDAIKAAGGTKVRFTTLENIGHNSWSAAYATPELYGWLNQHAR